MTYSETIEYLFGLEATRGWDLKLERVHAALEELGRPERCYPSVLIAGTNGKGTTAALTHAALGAAGHRAGLYTSPHLVHFTERIRVGDREIDEARVVGGVARIRACAPPEETGLTFFEMATLLAFVEFAEAGVDVAVLEVGLGGRLDATNVVEPTCSAVTSIGLDHQEWLGGTLAEIAREKAGVMREGRPTVLGSALPEEARTALVDAAAACGARLVPTDPGGDATPLGLVGRSAREDAAVAVALLDELARVEPGLSVDGEARGRGFREVVWPGRLDVLGVAPPLILDGAHNPESMASLCRELPGIARGRVRAVFGALSDKPWEALAEQLAPHVAEVVVVPVRQRRGVSPTDLARAFASHAPTRIGSDPCEEIDRLAREDDEMPILVTGSLFLLGEVYADLLTKAGRRSVFDLRRPGSDA